MKYSISVNWFILVLSFRTVILSLVKWITTQNSLFSLPIIRLDKSCRCSFFLLFVVIKCVRVYYSISKLFLLSLCLVYCINPPIVKTFFCLCLFLLSLTDFVLFFLSRKKRKIKYFLFIVSETITFRENSLGQLYIHTYM